MKLTFRKIRIISRLLLGVLLFAQGIVAVEACDAFASDPTQAYTVEHDDANVNHDSNNNACLSHCTLSDQISVNQHSVTLAAPVSVIAWNRIQPQLQLQNCCLTNSFQHLALITEPPISIRFCTFLN